MTDREQQILALIRDNPLVSQQSMAGALGISRSAVAGHIMRLTDKGILRGRGYIVAAASFAVAIGGANMDIHGTADGAIRMRDSNPGTVRHSPGGVARNVAENLARLGVDCRLIAPLGTDVAGDLIARLATEAGIDMQHAYRVEGAPTACYLSVLDDSGDMLVGISDMQILDTLDANRLQRHEAMLKNASLIVLDTNLSDSALDWLTASVTGPALFVDTVSIAKAPKIRPYLARVHTLKPGLAEAEAIAGISAPTETRLPGLAAWFHERGVQRLFISLGSGGVFHSTPAGCGLQLPSTATATLRNANGAGDALLAGLAYGWLEDWSLETSLRFGMSAADLTLAHPATVNPDMSLLAVQRLQEQAHAG